MGTFLLNFLTHFHFQRLHISNCKWDFVVSKKKKEKRIGVTEVCSSCVCVYNNRFTPFQA